MKRIVCGKLECKIRVPILFFLGMLGGIFLFPGCGTSVPSPQNVPQGLTADASESQSATSNEPSANKRQSRLSDNLSIGDKPFANSQDGGNLAKALQEIEKIELDLTRPGNRLSGIALLYSIAAEGAKHSRSSSDVEQALASAESLAADYSGYGSEVVQLTAKMWRTFLLVNSV